MAKQQKGPGTPPVAAASVEEEIRSLAYHLYCEGGCQDGRDLEYWLQAEQQILTRRKTHLRRVV
jgi:Protein of unknown function (DUF2934)